MYTFLQVWSWIYRQLQGSSCSAASKLWTKATSWPCDGPNSSIPQLPCAFRWISLIVNDHKRPLCGHLGLVLSRGFVEELALFSQVRQKWMLGISLLQRANNLIRRRVASEQAPSGVTYLICSSELFPVITFKTSRLAMASANSGAFFSA